ncbi:MAG TPA: CDC27 family protein [Candidatus Binatia bacterium]|nr:CDC27 family protein [Candidatus Binatia bacterium]
MTKKSTSLKFPDDRSISIASRLEPDEEWYDFEEWERDAELRDKKDYPGLVEYCKQRAERFHDDPYAQYYLGEAYVLNGEYEKAIEFLSEHHRRHPDNLDFQHVILDALFALGKTDDDFDWVQRPVILRMSSDILECCYEFLKSKRKPRSVSEIHGRFLLEGYLLFTEEDLLKALSEDGRFIVEKADAEVLAKVRVAGKGRTRKR